MSFYDLATKFEDISEETSMSNIAYLPTSVGIIKSAVTDLKRKKADWGIEILEDESGREVKFENALTIKVPHIHWNHFQQNFGRDLGLVEKRKLNEDKNEINDYGQKLANYDKAVARKKQLQMIIRMNKVWLGTYSPTRHSDQNRRDKIASAEKELAALVIPPKPDKVIRGFEIYVKGDYEGFIKNSNEDEAKAQAEEALGHKDFKLKSVYESEIKDLSVKELKEAVEDDMKKLRHDLKIVLNKLFKKFVKLDDVIDNWLALYHTSSYVTSDKIAVTKEHKEKDIQRIYGELLRVYGDDKGNLELLISTINEERPLNTWDVFKDYEYMYGCRISSRVEGSTLILESSVDFAYHTIQTINFSNPDVGDAIEDESDEIKRVGNVLYSPTGLFSREFFVLLNEIIEDLNTLESETEES
jgi:hypothetical protein